MFDFDTWAKQCQEHNNHLIIGQAKSYKSNRSLTTQSNGAVKRVYQCPEDKDKHKRNATAPSQIGIVKQPAVKKVIGCALNFNLPANPDHMKAQSSEVVMVEKVTPINHRHRRNLFPCEFAVDGPFGY